MNISAVASFESARYFPHLPETHEGRRFHGNTFRVQIVVTSPIDPETGWVIDFSAVKQAFEPVRQKLDHRLLNEIPGLENPTSENIARWIWEQLRPALTGLSRIVVKENDYSTCSYAGEESKRPAG